MEYFLSVPKTLFPAWVAAATLASFLAASLPARAGEPAHLALDRGDYGWVAAALLSQVGAQLSFQAMDPVDLAALDKGDLAGFDRWAAGNHSPVAAHTSDILLFSLGALPMALSAWDAHRLGNWRPVAVEGVIYGEALLLSSALNLYVRSLQIHPRPLVFSGDAPRSDRLAGDASGSFYSGHATGAFLAAVYLAYTYPLRHPDFQGRAWLWGAGLGGAATVAGLRVAAGKHFPSDVVVGAALGGLAGWAFPRMHLRPGAGRADLRLHPADLHPELAWTF